MAIDLTGQTFGRLTALVAIPGRETLGEPRQERAWRCRCCCGREAIVATAKLRSGHSTSCGCLKQDLMRELATRHGNYDHPLYKIWALILWRCQNPQAKEWPRYGGRGIRVCRRWQKFENFAADMSPRPPGATVERKKNNLGYSPANCRWATRKEQANNKHNTIYLTYNGKRQSMVDWANELGIPRYVLDYRKRAGWTDERTLTTPPRVYPSLRK